MSSEKGFTLIELLVVISIIGILATISTASYSNYKDRAKKAKYQQEMAIIQRKMAGCSSYNEKDNIFGDCKFSEKNCSEVGLPEESDGMIPADCGGSYFAGETLSERCPEELTWEEAYDRCYEKGSRLCSYDEIKHHVGYSTGCDHNSRMLWTMTPCHNGFIIVSGTPNWDYCQEDLTYGYPMGGNYYEEPSKYPLGVRCCADN